MPLVLADRVKVRTRTSGTGSFLIEDTFQGFQGFDAIGNGNETYYAVFDNVGNWEIGRGFYNSTSETLSRDTIIDSSNSGIIVNFPVGGKTLFVTVPSALLDVVLSGTSDSFKFISVAGQPTIIADNATDSLILEAGSNVSITTDNLTKKIILNVDVEGIVFDLNIAAEDSTVRNIRLGETIKFIGGLNITTSSDEEGNITISGPSLSTVAFTGSYDDLIGQPDLTNIGSLEIIGTVVDSNDSSEISFIPSVRFNSDVTIENELIVNAGIRGNVTGDIVGNLTGNVLGTASNSSLFDNRPVSDFVLKGQTFIGLQNFDDDGIVIGDDGDLKLTIQQENVAVIENQQGNPIRFRITSSVDPYVFNDVIVINSTSITPDNDASYTLGTSDKKWSNIFSSTFTGNLTGNVTGNLIGNITGDVKGSIFGDDSSKIVDAIDNQIYATGGLFGNLTGNVTGNIITSLIDSSDSSLITVVPNMNFSADIIVDNDLTVSSVSNLLGDTFLSRTYEQTHAVDGLAGTLTINGTDQERGSVYYLINLSADFTVNFANVVLSETKTISYAIMIVQGSTAYMPTAMQVNGSSVGVKWLGSGGTPIGNANYVDIVNVTLVIASGTVVQVLASLSSYA